MPDEREQAAEKLLGAVNDSAGATRFRFATILTVGAYVGVTVASTTDETLLRTENLVKLPLLDVQIPLTGLFGFYTVAPWLIVLLHAGLLLHLSMLGSKLAHFQQELGRLPEEQCAVLRERMASSYDVQALVEPSPQRGTLTRLSGWVMWLLAVALPLLLLVWLQVRFLPFHSRWMSWMHRAALATDVVLVLFLWPPRRPAGAGPDGAGGRLRSAMSGRLASGLMCGLVLLFSLLIATVPADPRQRGLWLVRRNLDLRERVLTTNSLGVEDINALRTGEREQVQDALKKVTPLSFLQGRDLRYANLYGAVLPKVDLRARRGSAGAQDEGLTGELRRQCAEWLRCSDPPECQDPAISERTQLTGADLRWAQMQGILLDDADLEGARLESAQLQEGSLSRARMNLADLSSANLQEAKLDSAKLCRANLTGAQLTEAILQRAVLWAATLERATLAGANLSGARLEEAVLSGADLRGANLVGAHLEGAVLTGADLRGASLSEAHLEGATLDDADLQGADLSDADLSEAKLRRARLQHAVVQGASLLSADREEAHLEEVEGVTEERLRFTVERAKLQAALAGLACRDGQVAMGLIAQARHSPHRDRSALAATLRSALASCTVLQDLSPARRKEAEAFLGTQAP